MWMLHIKGLIVLGCPGSAAVTITGLKHGTGTKACPSLAAARSYIEKVQA